MSLRWQHTGQHISASILHGAYNYIRPTKRSRTTTTTLGSSREAYFLPLARLSRHSRPHKPPSWRTWQHRRVQQVRDHEQRPLATLCSLQTISAPLRPLKGGSQRRRVRGRASDSDNGAVPSPPARRLITTAAATSPRARPRSNPHPPTASWSMHCLRPARRIQSLSSPTARAHRTVRPIPPRRLTSVCGRCSLRHTDHAARQTYHTTLLPSRPAPISTAAWRGRFATARLRRIPQHRL